MKFRLITILIFISLLFISNNIIAKHEFEDDVEDVDTPIDGGTSLLIGSGLIFGINKLKNKKDRNTKKVD